MAALCEPVCMLSAVVYSFMYRYTPSVKKQDTKLLPITSANVNRFSNSFAGRLSGKFATKHFKYHTLNMSLHYLVKYLCSKIAMLKK